MKRLILLLALALVTLTASAQSNGPVVIAQPSSRIRTATFSRLDSAVAAYADGDIIRASKVSGGAVSFSVDFPSSTVGTGAESGYITGLMMSCDTSNTANGTFDLMILDDTTGIGATLPADNGAFQLRSTFKGKVLDIVQGLSLQTYGTTAAGAGRAYASVRNINIPYTQTASRKLYFILICRGAYTPKAGEEFSFRIAFEI